MGSGDELGTGMLEQILGTSLDCHFGRASACSYCFESVRSGSTDQESPSPARLNV